MRRMTTLWMLSVLTLGCGNTTPAPSRAIDAVSDSLVGLSDLAAADTSTPDAAAAIADTQADVADAGAEAIATDAAAPVDALADAVESGTPEADVSAPDIVPDLPPAQDVALTPPPLFDLEQIGDAASAKCTFSNQHTVVKDGVVLTAWDLSYQSWESVDGVLKPIMIKAFAARPGSAQILAGVVQAHGLGGYAQESHATGTAALLGMFVIAYTGPGGGTDATNTSEGQPSGSNKGYRMFDVIKDIRGSWFWGHATAAMRAVTCLTTRPDIDQSHLGMTGFSAGGVVTLLSAGHDPRLSAAVPLSGTLAWASAVQSPTAWQHNLLKSAGLTVASPEWLALQAGLIDPGPALATTKAKVLMIDGTTDEFFPLTAFEATFGALPGPDHQVSLAANFDHGCYKVSGVESATAIEDRATLHASGGQRAWFRHWFGTDGNYSYFPKAPTVQVAVQGAVTFVAAQVDTGGTKLSVADVKVWASGDDAFVWANQTLDCKGAVCSKLVPVVLGPTTSYYIDVTYKTKGLIPETFAVSSLPVLAGGLVPHIRGMDNCL